MTIGETEPRPLTADDLARMPDDGRRYELVGGRLDVSPAPVFLHTLIESRLVCGLQSAAPGSYQVLSGPGINFNADRTHHRIPDVAVIRVDEATEPYLTRPPLLAIEVLSPESVLRDHHTKMREYAAFGIESYWIVTPDPIGPGIVEFRRENGEYQAAGKATDLDVFETDTPFAVRLVPHWLVAEDPAWTRRLGGE